MTRYRIIFSLLVALCLPQIAGAIESSPPSSVVIYQTLDRLWGERKFDALDTYITRLEQNWRAYVPAQLARAIYSYNCEVDIEDAIKRLDNVQMALQTNIALASPLFIELLGSRILRYRDLAHWYSKRGLTRDRLLKIYAPREMDPSKLSEHWGDEMLYFNAPEVFVAESGVRLSAIDRITAAYPMLEQVSWQTLQREVGNKKIPMLERKSFAQELVRRRLAEGGVSSLVQSLKEADSAYTYQDTVEEIVKAGPLAIPPLIEFITDPVRFPRDQKMAIWVLVRIGVADPSVMQTLQAISADTDRADLAKYAQDALRYLQGQSQ